MASATPYKSVFEFLVTTSVGPSKAFVITPSPIEAFLGYHIGVRMLLFRAAVLSGGVSIWDGETRICTVYCASATCGHQIVSDYVSQCMRAHITTHYHDFLQLEDAVGSLDINGEEDWPASPTEADASHIWRATPKPRTKLESV
jgi:hypothetical protein